MKPYRTERTIEIEGPEEAFAVVCTYEHYTEKDGEDADGNRGWLVDYTDIVDFTCWEDGSKLPEEKMTPRQKVYYNALCDLFESEMEYIS